eukprot:10252405-Lingulodinium_polyedra.AAC.1
MLSKSSRRADDVVPSVWEKLKHFAKYLKAVFDYRLVFKQVHLRRRRLGRLSAVARVNVWFPRLS